MKHGHQRCNYEKKKTRTTTIKSVREGERRIKTLSKQLR